MFYIEDARPEDFDKIVSLINENFPNLKPLGKNLHKVMEVNYKSALAFVVCKLDGNIIGAGCVVKTPREPIKTVFGNFFQLYPGRLGPVSPWYFRLLFSNSAYFSFIAVNILYRGKGLGEKMLGELLIKAKSPEVLVEVDTNNTAMNRLMQKLEFKVKNPFTARIFGKAIWQKSL